MSDTPRKSSRDGSPSLRRSLVDPIVLAAMVGLAGAGISTVINVLRDDGFERTNAQCDRAFAFLQDESVNPRLMKDEAFYQMQRGIAVRCSRSADR